MLGRLCTAYPDNLEGVAQLDRVSQRLAEHHWAKYDFKQMEHELTVLKSSFLDAATFSGPLRVGPSTVHGQGLFTTENVKTGELLLCEEAFAFYVPPEKAKGETVDTQDLASKLALNPMMDSGADAMRNGLVAIIVQKLRRNPSLLKSFVSLCPGKYVSVKATEVDGQTVIDT